MKYEKSSVIVLGLIWHDVSTTAFALSRLLVIHFDISLIRRIVARASRAKNGSRRSARAWEQSRIISHVDREYTGRDWTVENGIVKRARVRERGSEWTKRASERDLFRGEKAKWKSSAKARWNGRRPLRRGFVLLMKLRNALITITSQLGPNVPYETPRWLSLMAAFGPLFRAIIRDAPTFKPFIS